MAHLKTKATTGNFPAREQWKWQLVRGLYERGYTKDRIVQLFRLIDWMMILPEDLQNQFEDQLESYQEERKMPVLSRMELRGLEKGEQRGILLNSRESVIDVLETRFEEVPQTLKEAVNQIEEVARLKQLLKQATAVASLIEFEQLLG